MKIFCRVLIFAACIFAMGCAAQKTATVDIAGYPVERIEEAVTPKLKPVTDKKLRVDTETLVQEVSSKQTSYVTCSISQKDDFFYWTVQVTEYVDGDVRLVSSVPLLEATAITNVYGWPVEGTIKISMPSSKLEQDAVKLGFEQFYMLSSIAQSLFPRFITTPAKSDDNFTMSLYDMMGLFVGEDGHKGAFSTLKGRTVRNGVPCAVSVLNREAFDMTLVLAPDKKMAVRKLECVTFWNADDFFFEYGESTIIVNFPGVGEMTSSARVEVIN